MDKQKLPYDYLPIQRPLESKESIDDMWFYEHIAKYFIPDIIKLEATGIPIDLTKVKEVEETVKTVLNNVETILTNNPLIQKFLHEQYKIKADKTLGDLKAKEKTISDFYKPFNQKNKVHRSFVINTYLKSINKLDMQMDEWSIKDLRKLNQILASKFLTDLLAGNIKEYMKPIIDEAMTLLAETKATLYNKNKSDNEKEKLKNIQIKFNPNSSTQCQQFFTMLGIESDNVTKSGNQQWDRKSLEQLNKLLDTLIEKGE